jgi:hypothetical protein
VVSISQLLSRYGTGVGGISIGASVGRAGSIAGGATSLGTEVGVRLVGAVVGGEVTKHCSIESGSAA